MPTDLEMPTQDELRTLRDKARHIRLETIRLIEIAKVGHYSSVFSCAEIFAALYYGVMRLRRASPPGRTATASSWAGARRRPVPGAGRPGFLSARMAG